jgi:hypothetical protein
MREDCRHFESRVYDSGETARLCVLGLAPEQPWRCPENCAHYEPTLIDGTFETVELARRPVEDEPDADPDAIEGVLAEAEEPEALRELADVDAQNARRHWWSRRKTAPADGDDSGLSNR